MKVGGLLSSLVWLTQLSLVHLGSLVIVVKVVVVFSRLLQWLLHIEHLCLYGYDNRSRKGACEWLEISEKDTCYTTTVLVKISMQSRFRYRFLPS